MIALAKQGHHAVGYELNYWLVTVSRLSALLQGVHKNTAFYKRDLWKVGGWVCTYIVSCIIMNVHLNYGNHAFTIIIG